MTTNEPTQASAPTDHDALHEALEGIVDWADFAMKFPDVFNSHGVKLLTGPVFDDARELLASVASAPPDKSDAGAQWPKGCGKPNSCARHLACVYGCRVYSNRNKAELAAEIETVLTTLPAPTQAGELEIEQSLGDAAKEVQRLNALLTAASQREAALRTALEEAQAKIRDCGDVIRWLVRGVDFERSAPNGMRPTIRAALATNPGERP